MVALLFTLLAAPLPKVDASVRRLQLCGVNAVGFASPKHVWLSDHCGAVLESNDAGRIWRARGSYELGFHTDDRRSVSRFVWRTPLDGDALLDTGEEGFHTNDGGATWTTIAAAPAAGERPVWSAPVITRGDVRIEEQLLGIVVVSSTRHVGWSERHVYQSEDSGQSWFAIGDAPATVRRMAFVDENVALADTGRGWFSSSTAGRDWFPSENPDFSRYRFEKVAGIPTMNPFACTLEASNGRFEMDFGVNGCFGGTVRTLALEWGPDGSAILTSRSPKSSTTATLTAAEAREILKKVIAVTDEPEARENCLSTNLAFARLRWSCDAASHEAAFDSSDGCDSSVHRYAESLRLLGEEIAPTAKVPAR